MRLLIRASIVTLLLVGAVYAATLLWPTSVPTDLHTPSLDVHEVFDQDVLKRAESFDAFSRWTFVLSQLALLALLIVYTKRGVRLMKQSAAGPIGTGFLLGMLGFGLAWLVQLPFGLADFIWASDHDVVRVNFLEWALGQWAGLSGTFVQVCAALLVAMGFARITRWWWWVPAAATFTALMLLLAFVTPYLAGGHRAREALRADAARIAAKEDVAGVPLRIQKVSDVTTSPNAFATGLGPSRRVFLWDTLTSYPRREIRVTLAHEYGHVAKRHIIQGVAWFGLIALAAGLILMLFTRGRGGMGDPRAVPLALLVVFVLQLVTAPLESAVSRRHEAEADWAALNTTRNPAAFEALFRHFADAGLADPDPPGWFHVLFEDHPSGLERIEMARAWARANR